MKYDLIIDAKEARKQHDIFMKDKEAKELQKIMEEINNTILSEKSYIFYMEKISTVVANKLLELGYDIESCHSQKDGYSYKISW